MINAVEEAQNWVREMVQRETRCSGDTINAIRRLSSRHKIPYSVIWSLKYRPPKDLFCSVYEKLGRAYENEIRRAVSALDHERKLTNAKTKLGQRIVAAASSLDREDV